VSESRAERRRKARTEEQKRQEEVEKKLTEPRLPSFEAPASGRIVEDPPRRKR
jgi:hypothetical protein